MSISWEKEGQNEDVHSQPLPLVLKVDIPRPRTLCPQC